VSDSMKGPRVVLGTMTFGGQVDEKSADRILGLFLDAGHRELDTAFSYCEGRTEEILGRILTPERRARTVVATKANPWSPAGLKPERVIEQVETSLRRLRTEAVDILYLHAPDLKTPIEQTLEACFTLHRQGKFRELGLSNYAAWQVADIGRLCERRGWMLPLVYQGMYNLATRDVERELFPCVRAFGLRFYAYNPLAGGLLAGKYADPEKAPESGRFHNNEMYQNRYWKKPYFEALERLRAACREAGVSMAEAAHRWLTHHSRMAGRARDAVIVGVSSAEHLEANLADCAAGPLPEPVEKACDETWQIARPDCPQYFRT